MLLDRTIGLVLLLQMNSTILHSGEHGEQKVVVYFLQFILDLLIILSLAKVIQDIESEDPSAASDDAVQSACESESSSWSTGRARL
jgi:hypothetical protein